MSPSLRMIAVWPAGTVRRALTVIAIALAVGAVGGLIVRLISPHSPRTLLLAAAAPYLLLLALPSVLSALAARNWILTAVASVVLVLAGSTQARLFTSTTPPAHSVRLAVLTVNLHVGGGDPVAVVAAVRRYRVGLLMLEELTPAEQARLTAAGLDRILPYHGTSPTDGSAGTGMWSRYPLLDVRYPDQYVFSMVVARFVVPRVPAPTTAVALHMAGPVPDTWPWEQDMARLPATLDSLPRSAPVIVGGDFNATNDVAQFRRLLTNGYADAADQAGAGYTASYPSNRWYPPLLAIDHVLTRNAVASDVKTIEIPGSDHRGLLVQVDLPRSRSGQ